MASIKTMIQVQGNLQQQFHAMNQAMSTVIDSFHRMENASGNAIDTSALQIAQQQINQIGSSFNQVEQELNQANAQQQELNNNINQGTNAADGLLAKLGAIVATYLSFQGAKNVVSLSDELTNTAARLDLMNDNLQSTAQLQELIFQSAKRTYSPYQQVADMVGKLGMQAKDAFGSSREIIEFAEQINKTFTIAGTSAEGVSSVMLQLTQAMAAGRLQGEELNAILDNAQPIVANIQRYLEDAMNIDASNIKKLASEGILTAEIIKNAMFYAADETNAAFESMPITFSQIWTNFKNDAFSSFQPVLEKMNEIANNEKFQNTINAVSGSIFSLSNIAMSVLSVIMAIGGFIYDNWSFIAPLVLFIAGAFGALTFALIATNVAQWNLNLAILSSPLFWIPAAIMAIIAVIYYAIAAYNKFANTSISATGVIVGILLAAGATIANVFIYIWNVAVEAFTTIYNIAATITEGLINLFSGDLGAISRMFVQLGSDILGILESVAKGIDFVFGSNLAGAVSGFRGNLEGWANDKLGENKIKVTRMNASDFQLKTFDLATAYNTGYNWGANLFSGPDDKGGPSAGFMDALSGMEGIKGAVEDVGGAGKDTAGNTKKMADSMDMAEEDLKYLRDLAEQEVVNRFTTAEIKVDMANVNHINSEVDLDGVVSYLEEKVYETMTIAAEGEHE